MKAYHKQQEEIAHIKKCGDFFINIYRRLRSCQVYCVGWYLRQPREAGEIQAEDYRQDGGCRADREGRDTQAPPLQLRRYPQATTTDHRF